MNLGRKMDTARSRLNLGYALLLGMLLLLVGVVAYESYRISEVHLPRQKQATDLLLMVERLEVDLLNMETGKRGYLLEGEQEFLAPYRTGRQSFEIDIEEAREINGRGNDFVVDPHLLGGLETQYETLRHLFEQQIALRGEGVTDPQRLRLSEGNAEMDSARRILEDLQGRALEGRDAARRSTAIAALREAIVALGLGSLALLTGIVSLLYVRRGLVDPLQNLRDEALRTARLLESRSSSNDLEDRTGDLDAGEWNSTEAADGAAELREVRQAFGALVAQLRFQTERVRSLVASIEDPLATVDPDGRISYFNAAAARLTGFDPEEIKGRPLEDLVSDAGVPSMREAMTTGLPVRRSEEILRRRDGGEVYVASTASPLLGEDGSVVGGLKIMRDITERRQAEEKMREARGAAEEANRVKSEFLANMSHEIRTPMNGVIGMTDLLLDSDLSREQREYADTVRVSGETLLGIINDVLDFSKIEAGKLSIEKVGFDLRATVEDTMGLLAGRAHSKNLELASLIEYDVPTALKGDPGRIRQVLTNLIGNAIKFTEEGEVVLRVELAENRGDSVVVRFSVTDTGIGITEEQQGRIFESFTQADASVTRRHGGTGLGLTICRQLVDLMDGEMGLESEPGVGSTFFFTLPFEKRAETTQPVPSLPFDPWSVRILVVDDNETNRKILDKQLSSWGMYNEVCEDAAAALEKLRQAARNGDPYDLAILDMQMPGMNGMGLARRIKADDATSATPLILLTSVGRPGEGGAASRAGISAYLTKPVRQSELYDAIATVLGSQGAEPEEAALVTRHSIREKRISSGARLLLAEDNEVNQKVAVKMLERLGYRVDVAKDGLEALEAFSRTPYTAILMDVQMPRMDGYESTTEIRRREEEGPGDRVPIIAMTASAMQGDREKALEYGMDDYLSKPVRVEELKTVLARWVADAELQTVHRAKPGGEEALPGAATPLDPEVLTSLRGLEKDAPGLLEELVDLFLEDAPTRIRALGEAIEKGDAPSVERIAHALKGSSSNMGGRRMAQVSDRLQDVGASSDLEPAPELFLSLCAEFDLVREALRTELARTANGDKPG